VVGLAVRCGAVKRANVKGGTHGLAVHGPSATLSNVLARALPLVTHDTPHLEANLELYIRVITLLPNLYCLER
jgi:hypothetical protein